MSNQPGSIRGRDVVVATAVYLLAVVALTWPMARDAGSMLFAPSMGFGPLIMDVHHINWVLEWGTHALVSDPLSVFDANAFYPVPGTLALSEHLLGGVPIYGLARLVSGNAVLAYNVWLLASFVLSGLFAHLLLQRWTGSNGAGYVAGFAFAFAAWRFPSGTGSPHMLQAQYLPLVLLLGDSLLAERRMRDGVLLGVVLGVQTLSSYYVGYQAYLVLAATLIGSVVCGGWRSVVSAARPLSVALATSLVLVVPVSAPYLMAEARADIRPMSWTPEFTAMWGAASFLKRMTLRVGWPTVALSLLVVPFFIGRWSRDRDWVRRALTALLIVGFGLLLFRGPVPLLEGTPSPHDFLSSFVPGFANLRAPQRFACMASLGFAVLAGLGVGAVNQNIRWASVRWAVTAAVVVAVTWPVARSKTPDAFGDNGLAAAPVHEWLAEHGEGAPVLVLGDVIGKWEFVDARAILDSRFHWLPLVNGYTSHMPRYYGRMRRLADALPAPTSLERLVECTGVRWIVVPRLSAARSQAWAELRNVRRIRSFKGRNRDDVLFEVVAGERGECFRSLSAWDTRQEDEAGDAAMPVGRISVRPAGAWRPREERPVDLTVENLGNRLWRLFPSRSEVGVAVQLRWEDVSGKPFGRVYQYVIPSDVEPGETVDFTAWTKAPRRAGKYRVAVRLFHHGVDPSDWGSGAVRVPVRVGGG